MFWIDMNSFSHSGDRNNGSVRGIGDSI